MRLKNQFLFKKDELKLFLLKGNYYIDRILDSLWKLEQFYKVGLIGLIGATVDVIFLASNGNFYFFASAIIMVIFH